MNNQAKQADSKPSKPTAEKRKQSSKISCPNCGGTGRLPALINEIPGFEDCIRCDGTGEV
jgi:hypothetical protein